MDFHYWLSDRRTASGTIVPVQSFYLLPGSLAGNTQQSYIIIIINILQIKFQIGARIGVRKHPRYCILEYTQSTCPKE